MLSFSKDLIETFDVALTEDKEKIEKLKAEKFDAIFYESLFPHGGLFGHLLGIDVHFLITSSAISEYAARIFGIPSPSGWVPAMGILSVSDKMTFYERAQNLLEMEITAFSGNQRCEFANEIFQKHFGLNFPRIQEIMKEKTAMIFTSVNEFIEFPRPILHKIIYIGGLGMKERSFNESLQPPFNKEMKKGKNGVIFFSLGSNIHTSHLPKAVKKNLIDAFSSFTDYHFIIKLEADDEYGRNYAKTKSNTFVTEWAPQNLILQHSNLKLFFTHGGYNSLLETAYSGKPILLMPMMNDQIRNGQAVQRNGWGKVLDKMDLFEGKDKLTELMTEMLSSDKYQKSAERITNLLETQPFSANELFLKNVKFVLENDGKLPELQAAGADMNIFTQFNIDIYLIVILSLLLIFVLIIYGIVSFIKVLQKLVQPKKKNKKKIN
uniref:UDP-glucuronosyltransferase n=1 Tax=Panagrolaimus davidi TaxID=227884 RepID=A0A914PNH8_9BILA